MNVWTLVNVHEIVQDEIVFVEDTVYSVLQILPSDKLENSFAMLFGGTIAQENTGKTLWYFRTGIPVRAATVSRLTIVWVLRDDGA